MVLLYSKDRAATWMNNVGHGVVALPEAAGAGYARGRVGQQVEHAYHGPWSLASMPMVEKFGGIWLNDDDADIRFELHDPATDRFAIVFRRPSGLYQTVIFEKSHDPQWRLPFWAPARPDLVADNEDDAIQHARAMLAVPNDQ